MFKFLLYQVGLFITRSIPLNVAFKVARFISDLQYYFSPRDRKAVTNNLKVIVNSSQDVKELTKEVFRNFGRYLVEFFCLPQILDQDYIKENIKFEHLEKIDEVLKRGKGGIIVTAHIGNWELGAIVIGMTGHPLVAVALPHKERPVNDLFNRQRQLGVTVVPTNMAIRRCLETLRENKLIALVVDRDFGFHGEKIDFLGKKALIPKGAAVLSYKTGAAIIPMFLIREPNGKFTLSVGEPIYPPMIVEGEVKEDLLIGFMRKYMMVMEEKIRQYPSQWLVFRKFWID